MAVKPFTLDTVLEYRQRLEDGAKNDLYEARTKEMLAREKVEEQKNVYNTLITHSQKMQQNECSILDVISMESRITFAKQKLSELYEILKKQKQLTHKAHTLLVRRSKEKKVMVKLKEKQNSEWQKYLNKKEAAMLDEIAILRHTK